MNKGIIHTGLSRRSVLAGVAGATVAGGIPLRRGRAQAGKVIRVATVTSGDHPENIGARRIKELVEARSNGALEVRVFTDGQLGQQRELVENMRNGALEITWVTTGFFGSYEPILNVLETGYLFRDSAHAHRLFDGPLGAEIKPLVERHGVKLLGFYEAGLRHITNSRRAINGPSDLAGLKIRTPQANYHLRTLELMGASPTPMSFGELYSAMQQGVVDGQENPLSNIYNAKFFEVNDHLALTGHLLLMHMVMYSDLLWQRLSPDEQTIVAQAVVESQVAQREAVARDDATLLGKLQEAGMEVTRPEAGPFRERVMPLRAAGIEEFGDQVKEWFAIIDRTA
jgi:TRAP-type transport system periplasmic protein